MDSDEESEKPRAVVKKKESVEEDSDKEEEEEEEEEDEEEEEEDEDDDDDSDEDSDEIDLENYYNKDDIDRLLGDLSNKQASDQAALTVTLNDDIDRLDRANKNTIDALTEQLDDLMGQRLQKVTDDVQLILKSKQREKSDLQNMNQMLMDRIDTLTKKVNEVMESVESMCTISLCLMESQCM